MTSLLRSGFVLLYSLAVLALLPCLRLLARLSPKVQQQLRDRRPVAELAAAIAPRRARQQRAVLFFCSSAGEFEQARPLIDRLEKGGDTYIHVLFFSKSGFDYARSRGDPVDASLAPLTDSVWHWGWLFAALRPDVTVVVRHELWPGFLETARHYGRVVLVDASCSMGEAATARKRWLRGQLLRYFDRIYAVSDADKDFFEKTYALPAHRVTVTGDTKYDRVQERAAGQTAQVSRLQEPLARVRGAARWRLVLGSAHPPDLAICLAARRLLGAAAQDWQLVVAPHHVTASMLTSMEAACAAEQLTVARLSALGASSPPLATTASAVAASPPLGSVAVVLLDSMGLLAEAYGTAEAAFVGGAMHYQVHNVLEPATRGLALAYGPFYKNSQEAVHLVQAGLAQVTSDPHQLAAWWSQLTAQLSGHINASASVPGAIAVGSAMTGAVHAMTGAADRILADWAHLRTGQGQRPQAPVPPVPPVLGPQR